jgi:hypothetical protein
VQHNATDAALLSLLYQLDFLLAAKEYDKPMKSGTPPPAH